MAINNPVIADADIIQDTAVAIQEKDHGRKMEFPDIPSRIRALPTQDNALLNSLINRSITSIENSEVTSIGFNAFQNCTELTSVSFPNVTSIGTYSFASCTNLTSVSFPNVTSIGLRAFQKCTWLTSVSFPNVTSIGIYSFTSCTNLSIVILGKRVTLSNSNAFSGADNVTIYVQPEDLSWYSTATNWSELYTAGRVKSIEELPT